MTTLAPNPGSRMTVLPAEEARITLDSAWLGIGLNLLRTGPAEDASRYLNHLHERREASHGHTTSP